MNEQLLKFAKDTLKEGLSKCDEGQQRRFKQMYSHGNLDMDISEVVESMPEEKLDWAMQQVQRTLDKREAEK